jgi:hypothetical protein
MKKNKLLITQDASNRFWKEKNVSNKSKIRYHYNYAIKELVNELSDDEDGDYSTTVSQLQYVSEKMADSIAWKYEATDMESMSDYKADCIMMTYECDMNLAESVLNMEIIAPDENSKAA